MIEKMRIPNSSSVLVIQQFAYKINELIDEMKALELKKQDELIFSSSKDLKPAEPQPVKRRRRRKI